MSDNGMKFWAGCLLVGLGLLLVGGCVGGCYGCSKWQISDGYRDGTIRKLSYTGVVNKTWEVEMLGDGVRVGDGQTLSPETFQYTVSDSAVVEQIQALPPNTRVRVHYRKMAGTWLPNGETPYFIVRVEILR